MGSLGLSSNRRHSFSSILPSKHSQKSSDKSWIEDALTRTGKHSVRRCILPAEFMMWFPILVAIFRDDSYKSLLEKCVLLSIWAKWKWKEVPPSDSAVSKARRRGKRIHLIGRLLLFKEWGEA